MDSTAQTKAVYRKLSTLLKAEAARLRRSVRRLRGLHALPLQAFGGTHYSPSTHQQALCSWQQQALRSQPDTAVSIALAGTGKLQATCGRGARGSLCRYAYHVGRSCKHIGRPAMGFNIMAQRLLQLMQHMSS